MSYLLASTVIKRPKRILVKNDTQFAQQRTLKGNIGRDYFGDNKRVWLFEYPLITKADFDVIDAIYQSYLTLGTPKTFQSTETNYLVSSTLVHMDIPDRDFNVGGDQYISNFSMTLTEA